MGSKKKHRASTNHNINNIRINIRDHKTKGKKSRRSKKKSVHSSSSSNMYSGGSSGVSSFTPYSAKGNAFVEVPKYINEPSTKDESLTLGLIKDLQNSSQQYQIENQANINNLNNLLQDSNRNLQNTINNGGAQLLGYIDKKINQASTPTIKFDNIDDKKNIKERKTRSDKGKTRFKTKQFVNPSDAIHSTRLQNQAVHVGGLSLENIIGSTDSDIPEQITNINKTSISKFNSNSN